MPLADWPSGLPSRPLRDGFSDEDFAPPTVSEMEDGPEVARARVLTAITQMPYPLYFSHAQFATFKAFADVTLAGGTAHFNMPVFLAPDTIATRRCYFKNGVWRPAHPYRLGWIVRPILCVFTAA